MSASDSSTVHQDQLVTNLQLLSQIGQYLDVDPTKVQNGEIFLSKLRQLQNLYHVTQNRLDTFDVILPTIQQNYLEMNNLAKILNEKQQKISNVQNEKFDQIETTRLSAMAEMKFVESQLQSFDIQAKPPVTHSKISQMQKDLENSRCEYEILQQKLDHLMPCDEPTIDSLTNKLETVRDELRTIEEEISMYVTDAFQMNKLGSLE